MAKKSVLVIGGGIAGIQSSLDLANMGFQVYLVEKTPSIGGRMSQLDKTFPTNDCAMCILAPKMIEASRHPNIKLLTYSEVEEVAGGFGKFKVKIREKARFVNEEKCTGCGICQEKCPWKVASEFEMGLGQRKVIYTPFPQAVPNVPVVDRENCVYFQKGKCRACEKFCEAGAIDYDQKDEIVEVEVGAIILASGFDLYDPSGLEEYGYGKVKNVITAMQYERMISASGPTEGHLKRPSDGATPKSLAFIQCVGSRDTRHKLYCSSVCCMHATKEAILANEHYPELKSYIFYTDMRAVGKRFREYIARAEQEYKVTYIRSRPSEVTENPDNGDPIVWYEETTARARTSMEVDMVVLCQALIPSASTKEISDILHLSLNDYQFINIPDRLFHPVDTEIPGIFACGFCQEPQDIPDSVVQASAAAARAAEFMSKGD
ncbi:MAG: CoB--CoM heterodisulfide reductase iron-sulfur subunit A family protein [Chloroflexi bacterium]|nr:CoB--CoM heterodisulfide reductase iron-sulfur subunit A family protein [Chloroflexota bacterium]